jgi:hypothetical protein
LLITNEKNGFYLKDIHLLSLSFNKFEFEKWVLHKIGNLFIELLQIRSFNNSEFRWALNGFELNLDIKPVINLFNMNQLKY